MMTEFLGIWHNITPIFNKAILKIALTKVYIYKKKRPWKSVPEGKCCRLSVQVNFWPVWTAPHRSSLRGPVHGVARVMNERSESTAAVRSQNQAEPLAAGSEGVNGGGVRGGCLCLGWRPHGPTAALHHLDHHHNLPPSHPQSHLHPISVFCTETHEMKR